jgi:hypothetical protein
VAQVDSGADVDDVAQRLQPLGDPQAHVGGATEQGGGVVALATVASTRAGAGGTATATVELRSARAVATAATHAGAAQRLGLR